MLMQPRLDRIAYYAGIREEIEQYHTRCQPVTYADRLRVAAYLNSIAFNYNPLNPPRLDRTVFSARRHAHRSNSEMCGS